ncbi:hypothetical protein [Piscirickettsia salmonis]|uniref:hypothetical protein n=1 Tax=Piscirickettsia salmonis TaxID=1238 RepID=UPI0007C9366C|nr:hypothetical protein A0O36_02786 [Piscirickettsiaceae bacterium NZ-RLO1]
MSLGLDKKHTQQALDNPKIFQEITRSSLDKSHVQKVLDNPEIFEKAIQLGLDETYTEKALISTTLFEKIVRVGLDKSHAQKAFDNPLVFTKINRLKLDKNTFQTALDNPQLSKKITRLCLNKDYTRKEFNHLQAAEKIITLDLNKEHIEKALDNLSTFEKITSLGLSKEYTEKALNNSTQFTQKYQLLETIKNKTEETYNLIHMRSLGKNRKTGLENHYPVYKAKVMQSSFDFSMSGNQDPEIIKAQLAEHEATLLSDSGLENDHSGFGKLRRVVMRCTSNLIANICLGIGAIVGHNRSKYNANMSNTDKFFPFYSQTTSAFEMTESTRDLCQTLSC